MQLFFIKQPEDSESRLDEGESFHCVKVLRKKTGDGIHITNGKGLLLYAKITDANPKACAFEILSTQSIPRDEYHIHIGIAPTKQMERLEWFVEKATEIGIHEISFLRCENSERTIVKTDRVYKKLINAAKQSLRTHFPVLHEITSLAEFMHHTIADEKYIAHMEQEIRQPLHRTASSNQNYVVVIGPEGDFTPGEIMASRKAGYQPVNLGPYRLRTETAGIVACQMLRDLHLS